MVGDPGPQFAALRVAQRRSRRVVQDAVEQAIGKFQALTRIELLQLLQDDCLVPVGKVFSRLGFSIRFGGVNSLAHR